MALAIPSYAVKISGDSVQNSQWTTIDIGELEINHPTISDVIFIQEDDLNKYFYYSQFLRDDILREMQKAIKTIAGMDQSVDFNDLNTMEKMLDFCQAHHWLHLLYGKLQLSYRKGHLVKAIPTQLAKQKSFIAALATPLAPANHQPKMGHHKHEIFPNGDLVFLLISDVPASLHLVSHRVILEKEIGEIENRFNQVFGCNVELDLDYFDRHRLTSTSRHFIQNPQSQQSLGIVVVPITTTSLATIPLQHFYLEGKPRSLMSDELDYRSSKPKEKKKDQRHSYLCSLSSCCPPEDLLALIFAGSTIYDMNFYSQMIVAYIHRLTSISVKVVARTVNVPIALQQQRDLIHHHHHAIYHVAYAPTHQDLITIQVALGFGNKSLSKPHVSQPRLHFLDIDKVLAVLVSKDYASLHNKSYASPLFTRTGFEIANLDMCFFPYLERALNHSSSYQQWKSLTSVVAIFGTPSFSLRSKGVMRSRVMSLRFLCKHDFEPAASHAVDAGITNLAPEGQQPLYYSLALDTFINLPAYFSPQLQLHINPNYRPEPVSLFKVSDVQAAKSTYPQGQPAIQRVFLPVSTTQHTPSRFAEQFLALQRTAVATQEAQETDQGQPLPRGTSLTNRFEALAETGEQDDREEEPGLCSINQAHTVTTRPLEHPSYLSQVTGADDFLSQRSSAKTYPEMTDAARHRMDVAATAAMTVLNFNPHARELYSAVVREEGEIDELEQSLLRRMLRPTKQGTITASDQRAIKAIHNELGTKKATYIRTNIQVPASPDTTTSREGLFIQTREAEIDRLLVRTDLGPDDYLDIIYKQHQIQWREESLQRAATGDFSCQGDPSATGFHISTHPTDVIHEMALVRLASERRHGPLPIPRLLDPLLMHAALVTAIREADQVLQQTKQTSQPANEAQRCYSTLVAALRVHRQEQTQLAHLATALGTPLSTAATVTSAATEILPEAGTTHPMLVDSISESTKRDALTAQLDPK